MRLLRPVLRAAAMLLVLAGAAAAARPTVFVTIPPQAYLVERVAGGLVEVATLVDAGQSPHNYEPGPRQVAKLASADLFFKIGWPLEERLLRKADTSNPDLQVVDMRTEIVLRTLRESAAGDHDHDQHQHRAGEPDPHLWLDPSNAQRMARTAHAALARLLPDSQAQLDANLAGLLDDLARLDARLGVALAPLRGRAVYVYHPAYGYFTDAYGLIQVPVELGGKEPSARQLARLIERARADGVRVLFVQPQFSPKSAKAVAEAIDGAVVPLDPLARDYLSNLETMAGRVAEGLAR